MSELLPALRKTENIGRSVFSGKAAKRARKGTIIHEVFLESLEADSISVDRMDHATRRALAALSIQTGRNRTLSSRLSRLGGADSRRRGIQQKNRKGDAQ